MTTILMNPKLLSVDVDKKQLVNGSAGAVGSAIANKLAADWIQVKSASWFKSGGNAATYANITGTGAGLLTSVGVYIGARAMKLDKNIGFGALVGGISTTAFRLAALFMPKLFSKSSAPAVNNSAPAVNNSAPAVNNSAPAVNEIAFESPEYFDQFQIPATSGMITRKQLSSVPRIGGMIARKVISDTNRAKPNYV